jgi:hypothetical protein
VVDEVTRCPHCDGELQFQRYHAGFSNLGYMYCERDATVVTWSSYDPTYSLLSNETHPWMLDSEAMARIENAIVECPYAGRFRFSALPRCPRCAIELPELTDDPTYFVVLANRLDGEADDVWVVTD